MGILAMLPRKAAFVMTTFALLAACGPQTRSTVGKVPGLQGPRLMVVHDGSVQNGVYANLRAFTDSGTVTLLAVTFQNRPVHSGGRNQLRVPSQDLAQLRTAGSQASIALAQQIARTTYCRNGPLTVLSAETNGLGSFDGNRVAMRCSATNPYYNAQQLTAARTPGLNAEQLRAQIVGKTSLAVSPAHGPQISYLAANGQAYLWYPGNGVVNTGRWSTRQSRAPATYAEVCFDYGPNSFNPVTRQRGQTHCIPAGTYLGQTDDARPGDIFGLTSGAVPYVLQRGQRDESLSAY